LLAELSTDRIVLLSTHIVEDVSVLCPQFAVISRGRLLARSTPDLARGAVEGSIYEGLVEPAALVDLEARHTVTHALPAGSRKRVRLHAPTGDVPQGFAPVRATLEDAYLVLVRGRDPQIARALAVGAAGGGERMSSRFWTIVRRDLKTDARRPLFWIWLFVLGLMAFGLSQGNVRISSGEAEVGGTKAWISSEYGMAFVLALLVPMAYGFFIAVAAG
jgi:hypothetical protein